LETDLPKRPEKSITAKSLNMEFVAKLRRKKPVIFLKRASL
jgi:hypothetical protein